MTSLTPTSARHRRRWLCAAAVTIAAVVGMGVAAPAPAQAARPATVVSLTFDDGDADQMAALPILQRQGMKGTFFITSGYVGAAGHLTRANLNSIAAAGHEIGGHTVNHPDLTSIDTAEAQRQICTDRATLTSWGFTVRSFAYPFALSNAAVEKAAQDCGYRSARQLGDLRTRFDCSGCPYAETMPPPNRFATRALPQVESTWTLNDLKQGVLNGERAGGWVQYTFHNVCANACSDISVSPTVLNQFLTWLKPRGALMNTTVKTVGDVIGGAALPVVAGPTVPPAAAGVNAVVNPSMESLNADGVPACWMKGGWGVNSPSFTYGAPARTGVMASQIQMTGYASGDAKLLPQFDLGSCSPTVVPGHTYSLRSAYASTSVTQFAVYLRNAEGAWSYWTSSPWYAPSPTYTQVEWTSPPVPTGYSAMSFALTIFADGTISTDDVALYDSVGAPAAAPSGSGE